MKEIKTDSDLALELLEIINQRKQIEKREKALKAHFRNCLDKTGVNAIQYGEIALSLTEKTRKDLDRKSLIVAFGETVINRYLKSTTYSQLNLEKASVESQEAA